MIRWSRDQVVGHNEIQQFADVPGGALVLIKRPMAPPCMAFVPNVHVYDAGGQSGPFLKAGPRPPYPGEQA